MKLILIVKIVNLLRFNIVIYNVQGLLSLSHEFVEILGIRRGRSFHEVPVVKMDIKSIETSVKT